MKKITEYVLQEGVNQKVRELRTDFFSQQQWRMEQNKYAKTKDLDESEEKLLKLLAEQKDHIKEINENE